MTTEKHPPEIGSLNAEGLPAEEQDRRAFLKKAGKFAAVTPPAIVTLLSTSLNSHAIARSGGGKSFPGRGATGGVFPGGGNGGKNFE